MSPEQQLQVQKDIIIGKDGSELQTDEEYSSNQKLFFWYRIAVEMEFSQQLVFIRNVVFLLSLNYKREYIDCVCIQAIVT